MTKNKNAEIDTAPNDVEQYLHRSNAVRAVWAIYQEANLSDGDHYAGEYPTHAAGSVCCPLEKAMDAMGIDVDLSCYNGELTFKNGDQPQPTAKYSTRGFRPRQDRRYDSRYAICYYRPVRVYRNLNANCYSIKQDGVVKAHADQVVLDNVTWTVSEAGRQRVIREGRKNVHAYAVGRLAAYAYALDADAVYYNPYKVDGFRVADGGLGSTRLTKSAAAYLNAFGESFALYRPSVKRPALSRLEGGDNV